MKKVLALAGVLTLTVVLAGCSFGNKGTNTPSASQNSSTNLSTSTSSTDASINTSQLVTKRFTITGFT